MHPHLRFSLPGLLLALAACGTDPSPSPRLDLVSDGRLQTANRVASPGDTLVSRIFAEAGDDQPLLRRFTITVQYTDGTNIDANEEAAAPVLTYLDTLIDRPSLLWEHRFAAGTESGRELWRFEVTDADGRTARRQFRLTVRQPDSLSSWHAYAVRLEPPRSLTARAALASRRGLPLPAHAAASPTYQQLIDLLYLPEASGGGTLASPADVAARQHPVLRAGRWSTRRQTQVKTTALTKTEFDEVNTAEEISEVVAAAAPLGTRTTVLAKDQVVAFRTEDGRDGVLHVADISVRGVLTLNVKIRRPGE
ncbi:hypothetical protein [Hymenobacter sp. B81]|uniref:hypothetical protein n=1 Tax=Hymenobacter sp. B81 TaxID=3344878 RepID=UPI0037DC57F6